jgi:N12 class adenine-specific DNA methylase
MVFYTDKFSSRIKTLKFYIIRRIQGFLQEISIIINSRCKKKIFATKMTRIAGVQNTGSQRSMDMFMKVFTLSQQDKSVIFATGTPISNTIAEMYTMQRYLAIKDLRRMGLAHFDAWAATFGEVINSLERSPDGQSWRTVSRFANFINAPELITFFRSFADVQTAEELNLPRPGLKGNDRVVVEIEPGADLLYFIRTVITKRVQAIRDGKAKPWEDNMLSVTSDTPCVRIVVMEP